VGGSVVGFSYKSKYGSKALDQESWGDEINSKVIWKGCGGWGLFWLSISVYQGPNGSISYDRLKHTSFVIENHTIHLQMEAFHMID